MPDFTYTESQLVDAISELKRELAMRNAFCITVKDFC